ncbi:peptidoglycan DD-metalloendopeptidase family protein [Belliella kenyensis]|uniref:Peptidoglycan DD-metalloendopeptidase family protein n=1 Tax=Belliella kenyensis TaxID=1472724 RepID=A0ABV8EGA4_9BACT|nr:M23 family metallopeptidase [Belliella kenyensis]MCH7402461.1 M23 family metallopeptidase [Belliella kenyensis]MDN3603652.1 M23 family metallopeptidase [Belliella kenyensis]
MKTRPLTILFVCCTLLFSCNGIKIDKLLGTSSPYKDYESSLRNAGMENYAIAKDWLEAGESALRAPYSITLPYQEVTRFDQSKPQAVFLSYEVNEGQEIEILLDHISQDSSKIFIDVFEKNSESWKNIHFAKEDHSLTYQVSKTSTHAIRVQPELFRGGIVQIRIRYNASLAFPIEGKTHKSIGSFFGVDRDGGSRRHEGIDVFAPKGTPVLAVTEGRVSRVGTNRLGGKTVSLSSGPYSFYYAHLDSQLVNVGKKVIAGDTLGLVGNTGNAITTPPHLHFGIYRSGRGAVDPFHFLATAADFNSANFADSSKLGAINKIIVEKANLRQEPSTQSNRIRQLPRNTIINIQAAVAGWYRIMLPNGETGFIYQNLVSNNLTPISKIDLNEDVLIQAVYEDSRPFKANLLNDDASIIGEFDNRKMIQTGSGDMFWIVN